MQNDAVGRRARPFSLNTQGQGLNLTQRPKQLNYGIHHPPSSLSSANGPSPQRSRSKQHTCGKDPNEPAGGREREGGKQAEEGEKKDRREYSAVQTILEISCFKRQNAKTREETSDS